MGDAMQIPPYWCHDNVFCFICITGYSSVITFAPLVNSINVLWKAMFKETKAVERNLAKVGNKSINFFIKALEES